MPEKFPLETRSRKAVRPTPEKPRTRIRIAKMKINDVNNSNYQKREKIPSILTLPESFPVRADSGGVKASSSASRCSRSASFRARSSSSRFNRYCKSFDDRFLFKRTPRVFSRASPWSASARRVLRTRSQSGLSSGL